MLNLAPQIGLHPDADHSATRIPFSAEQIDAAGWMNPEGVALYRLAEPLGGAAGEVAEHLVVSVASDGLFGSSVAILATDADGKPFPGAPPLGLFPDTEDGAAALAFLGYDDVTGA